MKRKILKMLTAFSFAAVLTTSFSAVGVANAKNEQSDEISCAAKSAYVLDFDTGTVVYAKNENEKLPIASMTKIMTASIILDDVKAGKLNLSDEITVSEKAAGMGGSQVFLDANSTHTIKNLLKAVVIASANDACVAVCEYIAGTEEMFVERMNKRAQELGMSDTHYDNCVGFDSYTHYTSAYDTALLSAAVSEYDCYNEFFATRLDYVREGERQTQLLNTNKLMQRYDGIIGGKTGTTDKAGCCLAVWAKRGNMKLCAVALGCKESEQRFSACTDLLNHGFSGFELYRTAVDSDVLTPVTVTEGLEKQADIRVKRLNTIVIPKGSSKRIEYTHTMVDSLSAPVQYGEKVGEVRASLDGEEIFYSDIVTTGEVGELNFFSSLLIIIRRFFSM